MVTHAWDGTWLGLSPNGDTHQRSRQIVRHTGGIVRGKFPSRKNGRMIHHEGLLELDAIFLFETSPFIAIYREQLPPIFYADGAKLRKYTPDFEVILTTGDVIIVEVKTERALADSEVLHKIQCIQRHYERIGQAYLVLTEGKLRQQPRQSNLRWLYHQAPRITPTGQAINLAVERIQSLLPTSIQSLITPLATLGVDPFNLLFAGLVQCQLDCPISMNTLVHTLKEHDDAWFYIAKEFGF